MSEDIWGERVYSWQYSILHWILLGEHAMSQSIRLWRGISVSIHFLSGTIGGTFVAATAAAREAAQL